MEITLDEWIVHYLSDPQKRELAFEFLDKILKKCDRFVTIEGEALDQKIWKMAKKSGNWDPVGRSIVKWFMASFRQNSEKFRLLKKSKTTPLPPELERNTPPDDLYLIKAAITTSSFILTTDERLKEKLSHRKDLAIRIVDEFLRNYNC